MTYYAVIDTNVIVSSMLKTNSIPGLIVKLIYENTIIPILSEEILEEYVKYSQETNSTLLKIEFKEK